MSRFEENVNAYKACCEAQTELRMQVLKEFIEKPNKYVTCRSCNSRISREHAKKWYTFHQAQCLVCKESLLSKAAMKKLAVAQKATEVAYKKMEQSRPQNE